MRKLTINEMKQLALDRKGKCLSKTYVNQQSKLKWQCEIGHVWFAAPTSVKNQNSWCPHCASNKKLSLTGVKKLAIAKGGACLSTSYQNSKAKLLWKCKYGHIWKASTFSIKVRGSWCPHCYCNKNSK